MLRKRKNIVFPALLCALILAAGCGGKEERDVLSSVSAEPKTETWAAIEEETKALASENPGTEDSQPKDQEAQLSKPMQMDTDSPQPQILETEAFEAGPGAETGEPYKSSRQVMEAFAERIQEAVSDRDMEGFADMLSYPITITASDKEILSIKDRGEFLKQNPDLIFGDEFMKAIANVDTATLELSGEGVVMGEDGPGLTFQETAQDTFLVTRIQE